MSGTTKSKLRMSADEFLVWAELQSDDYEFVDGRAVAMSRDRKGHNVTKRAAVRALEDAIRRSNGPCVPYSDGIGVKTPAGVVRRPDASVECGEPFDPDGLFLAKPVIVVEVVSASSERDDTGAKFTDYFSIASIAHYLIVMPEKRLVIHHARSGASADGPTVLSAIRQTGELRLYPPGLSLSVEDLFPPELPPP
jgi:Uma2 family endonuclease